MSVVPVDTGGTFGVNSRGGLAAVERVVRDRINATHMENGVTIVDPNATYIDVDVTIGRDIGDPSDDVPRGRDADRIRGARSARRRGSSTPPSATGARSRSRSSWTRRSERTSGSGRSSGCVRGPCWRTAPRRAHSATSRTRRSGKRSKVPHLSYVGDATIGTDVNVGAGTVTVNFDGYEKHRTVIGDGASIGSDTMLIAPVDDREEREHGGGLGDHGGRAVGRAGRGTGRADGTSRGTGSARTRSTVARAEARRRAEGERGGDHHEEADDAVHRHHPSGPGRRDRGLPRDPVERVRDPPVREHASSTSGRRRACAGPTASSSRPTTSP